MNVLNDEVLQEGQFIPVTQISKGFDKFSVTCEPGQFHCLHEFLLTTQRGIVKTKA